MHLIKIFLILLTYCDEYRLNNREGEWLQERKGINVTWPLNSYQNSVEIKISPNEEYHVQVVATTVNTQIRDIVVDTIYKRIQLYSEKKVNHRIVPTRYTLNFVNKPVSGFREKYT